MNKTILSAFVLTAAASLAFAGTEYVSSGKEMRQTTVPQECYYGDTEFNASLWGTYIFAGTDQGHVGAPGFFFGDPLGDRYLQADHAWGGGADFKYFFHKYFGVGIEGWLADAKRTEFDFTGTPTAGGFVFTKTDDDRVVGSVIGTLTVRYPIACSRFAPYAFAGVGGIFGGGERDTIVPAAGAFATTHDDGDAEILGQFGGGMEVRITRQFGWISDFSWNVVNGGHNNFGMVRTGLNFAF